MDSVGTKSYRQRSSETLGFEAPAPHIVVVCPSCKTSFAVETAAVAALETPRFHCSRCDDIFVMKDAPSDMLPLGGVQVQSISKSEAQARGTLNRGRAPAPESLIKSSDFSLGGGATSHSFIEPSASAPYEPPPTQRSELSLLNKTVEEPVETGHSEEPADMRLKETPSVQPTRPVFQAPTLGHSESPSVSSRQFVLADPPPVLGAPTTQQLRPQEPPSKPAPSKTLQPARQAPVQQTEAYRPNLQPLPHARRVDSATTDSNGAYQKTSSRTQNLISMSTPLIAAIALLLGFSYIARLSPQSIDAVAQVAAPAFIQDSAQALPPSALGVRNLRLSFEKTRNKEVVPVVRGTVLNDSARAFSGVEIEVIGFNAHGELVASSRAPLRSALNNEKISNIALDVVRRLQSSQSSNTNSIAGQEAVPFSIALLDGRHLTKEGERIDFDPTEVKYFSARIFSVAKYN